MTRHTPLARLNRTDYFCLHEGDLIAALAAALRAQVQANPASFTPAQEALVAWAQLASDVPNGGFTQFFYNHCGDSGLASLSGLLKTVGLPSVATLLREALTVYRKHHLAFQVANPWDGLFGSIQEFDKLERAFMKVLPRGNRELAKWLRSHIAELATDETGGPIDPNFTGTVEILQPNGLVGEALEVRKGKPNGAYRQFFEDGSIRQVIFYKAGKVTGDFWPSGQLKRKESRRGPLTIIEWYFPSGQLQKRYVKNRDGFAVEPIQRFHENGQLAEEVHTSEGKKLGPWLRFFEDGSPQLQAEYRVGEKLIVHNAWAMDRTQRVKDGTGIFHEDRLRIDWEYDVFFEHDWRSDQELQNGVPHGKTTTYHDGVLWSVSYHANGIQEGETTTYWDNGRVRSKATYHEGKVVKTRSYPKFAHPVPAVVLCVEANKKLYTAWDHLPVDQYPQVSNLEDVQRQLAVPTFLREVHERNLIRTTKSEYEDCNTFKDGIAYFLTVNEAGEVRNITANGSGVYSGGNWDTYPPFLQQLRFAPGRVRGRAIECRVLATIDHTFVEGKPE